MMQVCCSVLTDMPAFVYHFSCSLLELIRQQAKHSVVVRLTVVTELNKQTNNKLWEELITLSSFQTFPCSVVRNSRFVVYINIWPSVLEIFTMKRNFLFMS